MRVEGLEEAVSVVYPGGHDVGIQDTGLYLLRAEVEHRPEVNDAHLNRSVRAYVSFFGDSPVLKV